MPKSIIDKHHQMLYCTTRVRTHRAGGSGTVLYSAHDASGSVHTYILTAQHVIEDAIVVEKRWNEIAKRRMDTEALATVQAEFFKYNGISVNVGSYAIEADIAAYSSWAGGFDLALLRVRDYEQVVRNVSPLIPRDKIAELRIFDDCYAVGAQLGHPPIATRGQITYLYDEIESKPYILQSASTVFGVSGGSLYRYSPERDRYEMIGVPARINVVGFMSPVYHMGYAIAPQSLYAFLENNDFQFIYDPTQTIEECAKRREDRRKSQEREAAKTDEEQP